MSSKIQDLQNILNPKTLKTVDQLEKSVSKKTIDSKTLAQNDIDAKFEYFTNNKILKKYMSDRNVIAYNVKEDADDKEIKWITICAVSKETEESMTIKELANLINSNFNTLDSKIDQKIDAVEKKIEAVDKKIEQVREDMTSKIEAVDKKVQGINDRIDNLVKKNKLIE